MTLKNAIKKAEKITGEVSKTTNPYIYNYKGYTVEFHKNGRGTIEETDAVCFYTKQHGTHDELMTDYFAGTFHDNLTQAFKFIDSIYKY
jgi:hypothetical protein